MNSMHDFEPTRHRRSLNRKGFTLIEMIVAVGLFGLLSAMTFVVFNKSSAGLSEVDSLVESQDSLRFAMERLRTDLEVAGSLGSPDSDWDPRMTCPTNCQADQDCIDVGGVCSGGQCSAGPCASPGVFNGRVTGFVTYDGWQDNTTPYLPPNAAAQFDNGTTLLPPTVSLDGVILIGAFDFPMPFEIFGFQSTTPDVATIQDTPRGLQRLHGNNLFASDGIQRDWSRTQNSIAGILNGSNNSGFGADTGRNGSRLLALTSRRGFVQFLRPLDLTTTSNTPASAELTFQQPAVLAPGRGVEDDEVVTDNGYTSALLDAFWLHVRRDPALVGTPLEGTNLQLVRERLCVSAVAEELRTSSLSRTQLESGDYAPSGCTANDDSDQLEVIAERIADFQIWFDCRQNPGFSPALQGDNWVAASSYGKTWLTPGEVTNCSAASSLNPGRGRVAHMRLTIHAKNDRSEFENYQFVTGGTSPTSGANLNVGTNAVLQTYDIFPGTRGAAPVVTMQTDVHLKNFAFLNL
jgi:prepilin-type N-terminal cleavage/methylation domain-containing protein